MQSLFYPLIIVFGWGTGLAPSQLACHDLNIILIQVQFCRNLPVR